MASWNNLKRYYHSTVSVSTLTCIAKFEVSNFHSFEAESVNVIFHLTVLNEPNFWGL